MHKLVFCLLCIVYSTCCFSQKLDSISAKRACVILQGSYKGENVYIQNPHVGNGLGFCVTDVFVNRTRIDTTNYPKFEMYSSAFEIDLKSMGFKLGDTLYIQIYHKPDCLPKVLNPCIDCGIRNKVEITKVKATSDGTLKWIANNENGKRTFVIEIFRWNKWVKVGEVDGIGVAGENSYEAKIIPHSGENLIRVKQIDYLSQPRISATAKFISNMKYLTYSAKIVEGKLNLSGETMYEVYDRGGNIVKRGFGESIDCKKLAPGHYFLNFDNSSGEFDIN